MKYPCDWHPFPWAMTHLAICTIAFVLMFEVSLPLGFAIIVVWMILSL